MPSKALRQSYRQVSPPVFPSMLCISARLKNLSSLSSSYLQNRLPDLHRLSQMKRKESKNKLCGSYIKTVTWFAGEKAIVPEEYHADPKPTCGLAPHSHLATESNRQGNLEDSSHQRYGIEPYSLFAVGRLLMYTFNNGNTGYDTYTTSGYTVKRLESHN